MKVILILHDIRLHLVISYRFASFCLILLKWELKSLFGSNMVVFSEIMSGDAIPPSVAKMVLCRYMF